MTTQTMFTSLSADPVILLEILSIVVTFLYMTRLVVISRISTGQISAGQFSAGQISRGKIREQEPEPRLISNIFNVGEMISTPKNYLRHQHSFGQVC